MNPNSVWDAPMRVALEQASQAGDAGEVPVGAVLIDGHGEVVAADRNRREETSDVTAHAEMMVLRALGKQRWDWRMDGHTLVVTLEPCAMCAMAAVWARLERIVYAAPDPKAGAAWSLFNIPQDERLNHSCDLVAGVLQDDSAVLLREFFEQRRL